MSWSIKNRFFENWSNQILSPKVSSANLNEEVEKVCQNLPVPVIWLLGKTQSGKSSIIQALTDATQAEIGEGFRPCTRTARVYDFPSADTAFVRFLDTRGLGESEYDPKEDLAWCQEKSHVLMVVIKAMDHQLDSILAAVHAIYSANPEWTILVVQSCLHEGYTSKTMDHIQPYPFSGNTLSSKLPPDLVRSLRAQREQFKGINARFVALDLTQIEDGFTPQYYGLEALWSEIENALPLGLRQMLMKNQEHSDLLNDVYVTEAHPHIIGYSISAGLVAVTPIPVVSVPLVIAVQSKLFHSISSIYGLPLSKRSVSEVLSAVGIGGLGVGLGVRELAKLIPGWGSAIAGLSTAAMTYALGMTLCFYYAKTKQGEAFTSESLKNVYEDQFQRGRELLKARFKQES
ncbi:hypothetical protein AU255_08950 [Methyloprofundus sedimenti]|uniref:G domain-containing protein n=1 Tax=Methyloprofundus sedimenti TaxID=1420851 RepID=A0A1V8M8X4_9GAMM|nr:DUF697 domain-containing protein [Methyloprofundus sedimenti]OQK17966.1 hypothetical protein AU255_08950 [Methyloprofundus sedimenti]